MVTVLFCDVRGFSRRCEQLQEDLPRLLQSIRSALGVMTNSILENDGTIADFQGDAAHGFWGWPVEAPDGPLPACLAALRVHREFQQDAAAADGLLEGFSVGIGIAHGRALAGQIGTSRQAKVGVFGPVANLGSRLEGLTRHFGVPICIDEATAAFVRQKLPPSEALLRRLGRVRPKGMDGAVTVYGLLPPESNTSVTAQQLQIYEEAVENVHCGRWDHAVSTLHTLPPTDGPTQFLLRLMAQYDNRAPEQWEGVFPLTDK
jgi:adenylate cyclase